MINSFSGENDFLSNFYKAPVYYFVEKAEMDIPFATSENAYQFAKIDPKLVELNEIVKWQICTPGKAKRMGQKVELRSDWEQVKIPIMEKILRSKFEDELLRYKLLQTGTQELVEGNTWGDTFWGVCNGKGSNHLGKLLMKIRKDFQQTDLEDLF